jgi:hypothetical protein
MKDINSTFEELYYHIYIIILFIIYNMEFKY